jgi:L-ascorbate metabolism protein UlaG (beta-lactamase superfamily)
MNAERTVPSLQITYIGHATVLIETDGVRLLTDPLLRGQVGLLRRQGAEPDLARCQSADAVLISHMHWDHLDLPSLRLLDRTTQLIVPRGAAQLLHRQGFRHVEEMRAGEKTVAGSLEITVTHAKHRGSRFPSGPVADCLGFIVRGRYEVYFAGDTDLFPEMATLSDDLDVALLPVWGWGPRLRGGHMNPHRAAQSLTLLRPRLAVPIHWGTFCPLGIGWLRPRFLTQPPHDFAYHAARLAPEVKVRVVPPGGFLRLEGDLVDET